MPRNNHKKPLNNLSVVGSVVVQVCYENFKKRISNYITSSITIKFLDSVYLYIMSYSNSIRRTSDSYVRVFMNDFLFWSEPLESKFVDINSIIFRISLIGIFPVLCENY